MSTRISSRVKQHATIKPQSSVAVSVLFAGLLGGFACNKPQPPHTPTRPAATTVPSRKTGASRPKKDSPRPIRKVDDTSIKVAVEHRFLVNAVAAHNVDVVVKDGIVTLTGTVENLRARERLLRLPKAIKGVRAVVDRITVKPVLRPDDEIKTDIKQTIEKDPVVQKYNVDFSVNGGIVTLTGTCNSFQQKNLVEDLVATVKGVAAIKNQIDIAYIEKRDDAEITADIRARLRSDIRVDEMLIDTHVTDGNVRLTGSVSSAAEKSQAYLDAWVVGVQSVSVRDLEVAWRLRDEMRRKRTPLVDSDKIRQAIKLAFSYDPRVEIKDLDINVIGGVVTLSGIVNNLKAKQAAARDAKNTTGVVDVKNHLKVRPPKRLSDKDLTTAARELLKRNAHLARLDITASARDGKVYLEGVVPSVFDKKLAENMVTNITGIQAIGNNLVVNSPRQIKPDWKILTALEERLYWNPMLDSFKIKPSVEGGVAVLRGEVDNWRERVTAGMEARKAGAWRVRNMLRIRPLRLQDKKPGKMGKPEKQNPKKVIPGAPPAAQPEPIEK